MPLEQSSSNESLHENIKKELAAGKPRKEAVAIAYANQKQAKEKGDADVRGVPSNPMSNLRKGPFDQHGAANPLGFVYGGLQNQYPYGG